VIEYEQNYNKNLSGKELERIVRKLTHPLGTSYTNLDNDKIWLLTESLYRRYPDTCVRGRDFLTNKSFYSSYELKSEARETLKNLESLGSRLITMLKDCLKRIEIENKT